MYPNIALMKLSAWHKALGDSVSWWWGWEHYDLVYMSKVFSSTYSEDHSTPTNADVVIRGGSGYAIQTVSGIETYASGLDKPLRHEIDHCYPDYSLYPKLTKSTAYGRLTVGCPKNCPWCHVCKMQGCVSRQVADLREFWDDQRVIDVMDANLLACADRERILQQLVNSKASINFNQGLDIQRMDDAVIDLVNRMYIKAFYFAWDDPAVDLTDQFAYVGDKLRIKRVATRNVYVLTNYGGSGIDDALERIYILRSLDFDPYVMIYNKPSAPENIRLLQRWCNNKIIFNAQPDFDKYDKRIG